MIQFDTRAGHIEQLVASRLPGHGLPRAFYHDEMLYAHEMTTLWRSGWVFAGHACQIRRAGEWFTITVDGDPLLLIRGDDGVIRGFHNLCTHRGTLLCAEDSGRSRALACPYHQWTFSQRGDLLSCHGMQDDIDKATLGLRMVHTEECAGLLFVSLAEVPPTFAPAHDLMAPYARPQGFDRAKVATFVDYEVRANWKIVWENNRECYHCSVNHPEYIKSNFDIYEDGRGSERIQQRLTQAVERTEAAWEHDGITLNHRQGGLAAFPDADHNIWFSANRTVLAEGFESESLDGRRVAPMMGAYRDPNVGVLRMRTLPNFWSHASCDHAVTTRLLPAGIDRTHVRVTWLVHEDAREGVDYSLDRLLPFWQLTSEQDWELCARVQKGVNSSAYRPGPLSEMREYNLDAFLRWYLRQLI
ncbi:MAG: rieske [2fe2s] domain containing protein [Chloroflexi bacterium]|nr:rieske [2fe2s] domain containing protein [Chloroflexota bacterium]